MSANTKIEWADHTFNPWIGCTKVSPGCDNCYAKRDFDDRKHRVTWGPGQPRSRTKTWGGPVKWNAQHEAFFAQHGRRQRVFCASLADVFDNEAPTDWRADLWALIRATQHLDWLLLTKRIGNAASMMYDTDEPLPNVWLGATVVNQAEADRDIPKLLATPAAVRFLSIEPMLGPIYLRSLHVGREHGIHGVPPEHDHVDALRVGIDWVICGGESGPGARPMHPDWARSLRDQCAAAGVPFLFKQWGEWSEVDGDKPTRTFQVESDIGETLASRCNGFISQAGEFVRSMDDACTDDPYRGLQRIGKKAAGRLLDGIEHNGFPGGAPC